MDNLEAEFAGLARVHTDLPGTVTVALVGELDLDNVALVDAEVAPALETGPEVLIIDASELRFADSSTIALWLRWEARVARLEIRNASPLLRRVLLKMGLSDKLGVSA